MDECGGGNWQTGEEWRRGNRGQSLATILLAPKEKNSSQVSWPHGDLCRDDIPKNQGTGSDLEEARFQAPLDRAPQIRFEEGEMMEGKTYLRT